MEMEAIFTRVCYGMTVCNSFLSLLPTVGSWKRKALGPGGRRPDAIVAAFFTNAAWLAFGLIEGSDEDLWINFACGFFQLINLLTYAVLCTKAERIGLVKRIFTASCFLGLTVLVGLGHDAVNLFKLFCTLFALAGAFAPIIVTVYMTEPKTVDILPRWFVSVFSIINGVAWVTRGLKPNVWNIPMVMQNGAGAFCSLWLLILLFVWDQPAENNYPPLLDHSSNTGDNTSGHTVQEIERETPEHKFPEQKTKSSTHAASSSTQDKDTKDVAGTRRDTIKYKSSDEGSHTHDHEQKFPASATPPKSKASNDTDESLTGASASTHKQQAMDIEKVTSGNAGAPKETTQVPAARVSSPAAPKAKIVKDPNTKFNKETIEIVVSTPKETPPVSSPAAPKAKIVEDPNMEFDKETIEIVVSTPEETSPAPATPVSSPAARCTEIVEEPNIKFDKETTKIVASTPNKTSPAPAAPVASTPNKTSPAPAAPVSSPAAPKAGIVQEPKME